MLRHALLLAPFLAVAACTSSQATVQGSVQITASATPPTPSDEPFDDSLDSIDEVRLDVVDDDTGSVVKSVDVPVDGGAFEVDGVDPGSYHVEVSAIHHRLIGPDEILGAISTTSFDTDSGTVDLGPLPLVYQPEY